MVRKWLTAEENALKELETKCIRDKQLHEIQAAINWRWNFLLSAAIAVLSLAAGAISFATGEDQQTKSVKYSTGAVNLCAAGVTWLSAKVSFGKRSEGHRVAAQSYAVLIRNIRLELDTPRRSRTVSGATFLHVCMEQVNKILEESPDITDDVSPVTMNLSEPE